MERIYNFEDLDKSKIQCIRDKYDINKDLINFSVFIEGESPKHYKKYYFYTCHMFKNPLVIGFVKNEQRFNKSHIDDIGDKIIKMPVNGKNYIEWEYVN